MSWGMKMNRNRKSWVKKVNEKISPDRTAAEFAVVGKTNAGLTDRAKIGIGIFGSLMVVAFLFGYILFPGGLFLVWLVREMKPPRLVTVSPSEISSYSQSLFNNKPRLHIAVTVLVPLQPSDQGAELRVGNELVVFKKKEYRQLVEATQEMMGRREKTAQHRQPPTPYAPPERLPAMAAPVPEIFS
jgi:hypothetical protein